FFRGLVWKDVKSDPVWYASILARRVVATATQDPLLVFGGRAERSLRAQRGTEATVARNQGRIRFFYRLLPTADWLGLGSWRWAAPIPALWVVGAVFLGAAGAGRTRGRLRPLQVAACVAAAVLPLPVLITTASA